MKASWWLYTLIPVIGEDPRYRRRRVIRLRQGHSFDLQNSTTPLLWAAVAVRRVPCFEVLRLCDESPASSWCSCEIRIGQKKFDDDGNDSMRMLVPTATIVVEEDARSSSTLAFVYLTDDEDSKAFLVIFFFGWKSKVVIFGEERV